MRSARLAVLFAAGAVLLAGCTSSPPKHPIRAKEEQSLSVLKTRYKDIVSGIEPKGALLSVFVNVDRLDMMDESAEDTLKAEALTRWKAVWSANHPHRHAKLQVHLRDYYGRVIFTEAARV